jgi:hypothetical protein
LDKPGLDVLENRSGDTLQCRLVHLSDATVDPDNNCSDTLLFPSGVCRDDPRAPPDCQKFCRLNHTVCAPPFAVYESALQCLAVCLALIPGTNGDLFQNTVGCRLTFSYIALDAEAPQAICPSTGPGGDGLCGMDVPNATGNCVSYCALFETACGAEFARTYSNGQGNCMSACSKLAGAVHESGYVIADAATGETVQCRLLHVSRALVDPLECESAAGHGFCSGAVADQ